MIFLFLRLISTKVYFSETFDDDDWEERWVYSKHKPIKGEQRAGTFRLSSGSYYGNRTAQRGIQTIDDVACYQITSKFAEPFNTSGKDFILQYTVKFEKGYECSGGYIKLLNSKIKPLKFSSTTPYELTFGPDVCKKPKTNKVLFIISKNDSIVDNRKYIEAKTDELTHAYTLIIYKNHSYEIRIDGIKQNGGDLSTDFELSGSKMIPDPSDKIPDDWDNREFIPDPTDKKPDDWDDRQIINDPDMIKPNDWDEKLNGEWKAPLINNPDYKGVWKQKMIPNPNYKGDWVPKMIPNPSYFYDENFGVFEDLSFLGIEVFQNTPGTIFDNFLVTDDLEYSENVLRMNFLQYKEEEASMYKRVLQDRAAEAEMKKIRQRESNQLTEDDFYSQTSTSSETSSIETGIEEDISNFDFDSDEITDLPKPSLFNFPYDIEHNNYFIAKKKNKFRKSSPRERNEWREEREKARQENEISEDEL